MSYLHVYVQFFKIVFYYIYVIIYNTSPEKECTLTSTTQRKNHDRHCSAAETYIGQGQFEEALDELNKAREALHEAGGTARCEYLVALCLLELGHDASGPLQEAMRLFFRSDAANISPDPHKEAAAGALLKDIRALQIRVTLREAEALIAEARNENGNASLTAEALKKLDDALESNRLIAVEESLAAGLKAYCQWLAGEDKWEAQQVLFASRRLLKRFDEIDMELVVIDLLLDTGLTRLQAIRLAIRETRLRYQAKRSAI